MSKTIVRSEIPEQAPTAKGLMPAPWDRQPDEPMREFDAFRSYLNQEAPRSIVRVFEPDGTRVTQLMAHYWLREWDWRRRVEAYDAHLHAVLDLERENQIKLGMAITAEKQLRILRTALDIAEVEFNKLYAQVEANPNFSVVKPGVLLQLLEKVITLQRLITGESTQKIEIEETYDFSELPLDEVRKMRDTLMKAKK